MLSYIMYRAMPISMESSTANKSFPAKLLLVHVVTQITMALEHWFIVVDSRYTVLVKIFAHLNGDFFISFLGEIYKIF